MTTTPNQETGPEDTMRTSLDAFMATIGRLNDLVDHLPQRIDTVALEPVIELNAGAIGIPIPDDIIWMEDRDGDRWIKQPDGRWSWGDGESGIPAILTRFGPLLIHTPRGDYLLR